MDKLTAAQVFLDIAITQSFTATAERLDISRPMVTRHVETMETWLQARLLNRTTRKVSLTSAGVQCLDAIKLWVEQAQQLEHQLMDQQSLSGKIRIATSMSFGFSQLIPAVKPFLNTHPNIEIDIDVQDKTADLIAERIDLAIRIAADPDPSLIGRPIAQCDSVLVASPEYLMRCEPILTPSDLSQHRCLGYKNFERHIWHLKQDDKHQSVEVPCQLTANEATTLLHAAIHGMGVALQPTYLAKGALERGDLQQVLAHWQPKKMDIYALYPSRRHLSPAVRALIDHLKEYFMNHDWQTICL
ncbi:MULTISPECIES: LysR family transcriptional regulator [Vibrio]|uniref:LysR family transcriptional regulator n=1 Tax=Vibrio TaxID=662 RepID=UPI000B8E60C7|nr:LysR family transcriptional regulator [Vibrio sp. V08_P9A1T1]OXX23971.1 LysR family transcriptional regulator [Vibrio sp. V08_P9A1T1]OXX70712.1 LysR family transcriptional regulator [Vibrio sp. V03_P4A6T147]